MTQRWRGKETDKQARRMAVHKGVFGHSRSRILSDNPARSESPIRSGREMRREKPGPSPLGVVDSERLDEVLVDVEREVYLDSERQWLGVGHASGHVLGTVTREKSEGFEDQVVKELYRRGYTLRGKVPAWPSDCKYNTHPPTIEASKHNKGRSIPRDVDVGQGHVRGGSHRRSWWQTIYQRVSQSGGEDEQEKHLSPQPNRKSASRPRGSAQTLPLIQETQIGGADYPYEDPPPPSTLDAYHSNRPAENERKSPRNAPLRAFPPAQNLPHQSPEPIQPIANPQVQFCRSDSLLDRMFTYLGSDAHATDTDLEHSAESQPSPPTSLWRAGSANVIPKHNKERSNLTPANISDGVYPHPITPVRGDIVGVEGLLIQDEELSAPPPRGSHTREIAGYSLSPSHSPLWQSSSLVTEDFSARSGPPVDPLLSPQPPGIPEPSAYYNQSFPPPSLRMNLASQRHVTEQVEPVSLRTTYPFQISDPRSRLLQQYPNTVASSPPDATRPCPAVCGGPLLRPLPGPIHYPSPHIGQTGFTPPRGKLAVPTPLAQPLPRGSGSLKKNKTLSLSPIKQHNFTGGGLCREPPNRSRRHSQPIPALHYSTDPNYMPHPPNRSSRNPHRRTSQPLHALREASHPNTSPPSSPPHRPSRRLSSPPLSALPLGRPSRSNAIYRKPQSPGSRSLARVTGPRTSLLEELRGVPPLNSTNFTRHPVPGTGSAIGSSPRNSRTSIPLSPRTPTFVNTHMLPPPPSSPRSDVEEWASAVSSFSPSVRTK